MVGTKPIRLPALRCGARYSRTWLIFSNFFIIKHLRSFGADRHPLAELGVADCEALTGWPRARYTPAPALILPHLTVFRQRCLYL